VGLIHLDAGVVIGFLNADDVHHDAARATLESAVAAGDVLAMAASALSECLVGPARRGRRAVATVRTLIDRLPIIVVPLDVTMAVSAASLRAAHRALRLPDALVIATAEESAADQLVTTDRDWPSARALNVKVRLKHLS
jgi:predicted nucleic acid-binding protein